MDRLDEILKKHKTVKSVNSSNSYLSTVDSNKTVEEQISGFLSDLRVKPEALAKMLAEFLDDLDSLGYYLLLVKENPPGRLFEALGYVKEAAKDGRIRTKKAIYFIAIIRNWGLKTKFKKV